MSEIEPNAVARDYVELVDRLRERKAELGLSDAFVEEQLLLGAGGFTKYLGRCPTKTINGKLGDFLEVLGLQLRVEPNPEAEARMRSRWEQRDNSRVHPSRRRVSQAVMEIARPLVLEAMSKAANEARTRMLPGKQRAAIARKAARAKWRIHRAAARARAIAEGARPT
jgi:hypothetical protein